MIAIRKDVPKESESVLSFYHSLIEKMQSRPVRPTWTKGVYPVLGQIISAASSNSLLIAVNDGAIIGSVILTEKADPVYDTAHWSFPAHKAVVVHLLAVDPDHHGEGIAFLLLSAVRDLAAEWGADAIRLDTLPDNTAARHLYTRFGFRYCGDISLYYPSAGTIPFSLYDYAVSRNQPS